ncbi:MAG: CDP-alcohol phosphatidyltransferase family protein [Paracoccaceae bacterium]|nr:CDP-alcohol phosphatidyltransferase family protein [Paracoccaceae bacterium]
MTKDISLRLVGDVPLRLWGMDLREWQARAWNKAGARVGDDPAARMLLGTEWVLSPALQRGLLARPGAALIVPGDAAGGGGGHLAALHLPEGADAHTFQALIGQENPDMQALRDAGFHPGGLDDFAGSYDEALRKREAPYALSMRKVSPRAVEQRLFTGSYKGVTDLVTKYAWPLPAFHATRAAAALHISPNTVTTASLVLVVLAFWLFWIGAWAPGIVAAWAMTFLDTVDGKLARTTMSYSKWGDIYDHSIDLIHPPFWYWAIWQGAALASSGPSDAVLAGSFAIILAGYVLNRVQEGMFIKRFGFHIHVWQPLDSLAREITARRNPNMVIFMLAVMLGQPGWGLVAVAVWTLLWLLFHGVRLMQAMAQKTPLTSWMQG